MEIRGNFHGFPHGAGTGGTHRIGAVGIPDGSTHVAFLGLHVAPVFHDLRHVQILPRVGQRARLVSVAQPNLSSKDVTPGIRALCPVSGC